MTLTKTELIRRLTLSNNQSIILTPILDFEGQINHSKCGIDVRLGRQFLVFNSHFIDSIDPANDHLLDDINKYQQEIVLNFREKIVLHPGELMIASTLEYLTLPADIECQVEGRSSWARLGLIIATATTIEPLYKGVITLELSNNGTVPITLYPGLRIAQLIFHKADPPLSEQDEVGKYQYSIGPSFSRIYADSDLHCLVQKYKRKKI